MVWSVEFKGRGIAFVRRVPFTSHQKDAFVVTHHLAQKETDEHLWADSEANLLLHTTGSENTTTLRQRTHVQSTRHDRPEYSR